jgi:hypothetical protein
MLHVVLESPVSTSISHLMALLQELLVTALMVSVAYAANLLLKFFSII